MPFAHALCLKPRTARAAPEKGLLHGPPVLVVRVESFAPRAGGTKAPAHSSRAASQVIVMDEVGSRHGYCCCLHAE
jgi:hypothetical protein